MIRFETTESVRMPRIDVAMERRWLTAVAERLGFGMGNVTYRFCNDEEILAANREFIDHDYFTDVITFDYTRCGKVGGDVLISLDTVESNAELLGVQYERELHRVIVHGVLHLCGINDKGPGEREIMEQHEDAALVLLDEMKDL